MFNMGGKLRLRNLPGKLDANFPKTNVVRNLRANFRFFSTFRVLMLFPASLVLLIFDYENKISTFCK